MPAVDPNAHDRFTIRQRFRPVVNEYEISLSEQEPFCFVRQKRFSWKEELRFFADDSRTQELLRMKARQRFDPAATYDVALPDGTNVGEIQKRFGAGLLRSTYHFTFTQDGREIGTHRRRVGRLRDVYDLDLSGDTERVLDRRLALAVAVGPDALQAR